MTDPFEDVTRSFEDIARAVQGMKVTFRVRTDPKTGKQRLDSASPDDVFYHYEEPRLTPAQDQLVEAYHQRVVVAVRNARYYGQLRRQRYGVRVVHHVATDRRSIRCNVFIDPEVPLGQVWEDWFPS